MAGCPAVWEQGHDREQGSPTCLLCPGACCIEGEGQWGTKIALRLGQIVLSPSKLICYFSLHVKSLLWEDLSSQHSSIPAPQPFSCSGSEKKHKDDTETQKGLGGKEFIS